MDAKKQSFVPANPKGAPKKTPGLSPFHQDNTAEPILLDSDNRNHDTTIVKIATS